MKSQIKVTWCEGKAWAFYDKPKDAYEQVATLTLAGFGDAKIVWPKK